MKFTAIKPHRAILLSIAVSTGLIAWAAATGFALMNGAAAEQQAAVANNAAAEQQATSGVNASDISPIMSPGAVNGAIAQLGNLELELSSDKCINNLLADLSAIADSQ